MSKRSTVDDPVVAEVRAVRAELWREAGATVSGLIQLLDRQKITVRATKPRRTLRRKVRRRG